MDANNLKGNNTNTSALLHDTANARSRINSVLVVRRKRTLLGNLRRAVGENIVLLDSEALLVGVEVSNDGLVDIGEGVCLDEDLGAHARVDAGDAAVVARAVDVAGTEAD